MTNDEFTYLKQLRRYLHKHPEVSGQEKETASRIVSELKKSHPDRIVTGLGGNGVAAVFGTEGKPAVMLRCELDAIPVTDSSDTAYRSVHKGVSHACGHDGHMAIMVGVARLLGDNRPEKGRVTLLFQPSEETGQGAERVIADPQFDDITSDRCYALHNLPGYQTGVFYLREGTFASASVGLKCILQGSSSHAAFPEQGISPVGVLPELIEYLQQLCVPDPGSPTFGIGTVTYIELGEKAFGINPGRAEIGITLRSATDDLLEEMKNRIRRKTVHLCEKNSLELTVEDVEPFVATVNSAECLKIVTHAIESGDLQMKELSQAFPWSEDFGHFSGQSETALIGIGAGENEPHLHSEVYDFNDELLPTAVHLFETIIREEWKMAQS